ncbi:MAG: hypothetical protein V4539_22900 [Bacteroidota bacterium]
MKKIVILFLLTLSMQTFAQSYPPIVPVVVILLNKDPDAITTNWGRDGSVLSITASTKPVNGRIDARVIESKILVVIKKGGAVVCGSYTANSAPAANFTEVTKVWKGNDVVALLGKSCVLSPGDYQLCVQFLGNDAKGIFPLGEEVRKPFSILPKERPTNQPPQTETPVNNNPVRETDPKTQTNAGTTIVDPRQPVPVSCDCGKWGPLVINNREKYYPDSKITASCKRPLRFSTTYQCSPSNESCNAGTTWQVTKDGVMIKNNTGNSNISEEFTPTGNGVYTLTLNASCNNKRCEPVSYSIIVSDCGEGGGGGVVTNGGGAIACDCGAWRELLVNGRDPYKPGSKITGNCNRPFQFSTTYQCSSVDRNCQAGTTWQITKDGVMIKNNTGNNNIKGEFTPTGNGTYILTLNASCNNKKCAPVSYSIVVSDCGEGGGGGVVTNGGVAVACDCGAWGNLLVNGRDPYKSGSKITGNCNRTFRFSTSYQCNSVDKNCNAGITWQVTKDGVMIKNNTGNNNISEEFTPTGNGTYTLTFNAFCNNKKCEPVTYTIVVSDCSSGGGSNVTTCDCGRWNQVVVNKIKYDPGSAITGNCNQRFQFSTSYQCTSTDESCQAKTSWDIKKDGAIIKTGNGNNQINEAFVPNGNGTYAVTLYAVCNGKKCTQGNFTIVVNDCVDGGGVGGGSTCDCSKDMYVTANPGVIKIRCNETKTFDYGTTITITPQNICSTAECLSEWSMNILDARTGALIKTEKGAGSNSFLTLVLNSVNGYNVELTTNCNGKICKCGFTIKTTAPKEICDCGAWMNTEVAILANNKTVSIVKCSDTVSLVKGMYGLVIPQFTCSPGDSSCRVLYAWTIQGAVTINGSGQLINFNFNEPGLYTVTINPVCGGKKCIPCKIMIKIENPAIQSGGGGQGVNQPSTSDSTIVNSSSIQYYYDLQKEPTYTYTEIANNILNVQFYNNYASGENVKLNIYDVGSKTIVNQKNTKPVKSNSVSGLNRISIDIKAYQLEPEKLYLLTVSDFISNYHFNFKVINDREK